ncbi:MAG: sensor domain-containing diguanylate cyclase [Chloroflexi bacterium]|nr:sensor domain-containing diguanylate cyclase [Chloroflexota bacterium]
MPDSPNKEEDIRRMTAIIRIHHSFGSNLELDEISRIAVRDLVDIVGCDACAILLIEGNDIKILAERGFSKTLGQMKLTTDTPAIKYIMATRQSIFTGDVLDSPAAACVPAGCSMRSLICAPIIVKNEVTGIIHLDSSRKNAFDKDHLEFVELLANEIAIAIERSLLYSEIQDIATKDGLTGSFNRRKLDVDLIAGIAVAQKGGKQLSFLMMDIDWFKKYNDFHGHLKGDRVLQKMASVLKSSVRAFDSVYRYGGEEFAILLPDTGKDDASRIAGRVRDVVGQEAFEGERESQPNQKLTVSIGIASFPADAQQGYKLVEAADSALYAAKRSGRNRVCIYGESADPGN